MGVNRISFGFQSLNLDMLKFMSRWHTPEDSIRTFKNARKAGYSNINIDMIFGIPGQTLDVWSNNLETIVSLEPEHISAYSLTVEKQTLYIISFNQIE